MPESMGKVSMKFFTIGYGGRDPKALLQTLADKGIKTVIDVRLRPDRARLGTWAKASTPDKGIERFLADAGIGYVSIIELGNIFLGYDDWEARYKRLLEKAGDLLVEKLAGAPQPFCLLFAESRVAVCHRRLIAEFLVASKGGEVEHIE
jgi:uncharacterized protein (DUF488 family)